MNIVIISLIAVLTLANYGETADILFIVPFTSKSHYIYLRPIGLELARRGHNVTVITANREQSPPPNYHQVMVDNKEIWDVAGKERPNIFDMVDMSAEEFHDKILWHGNYAFTEVVWDSKEVQDFLKKDNKFDLVISEHFYQESLNILAHKYKAPLALLTTFGNCMKHNFVTGNPLQLATVVFEYLDLKDSSSFLGRLRNFYFTAYEYMWWRLWYLKKQENLVRKYLPDLQGPVPSLFDIQKNASIILINGHYSFDVPMAYLPNVIEVGGLHLSKSEGHLPKDLQKCLDEAKHGVIYMNFGSNLRISELPHEKKEAFFNVFRRLKQIVLCKWENDEVENKPDNLVTRKWLPQKEILGHPNVVLFITHGGLIGTEEAIYNGVPLLGTPIYADQYNNLLQVEAKGFGKMLEYHDINEENLEKALNEILNDVSYRNNAKEIAKRFKDRPMPPLDTAMFWFEYVLRHNGAHFMKNPAREMNVISYLMLDVYIFIIVIAITIITVVMKTYLVLKNLSSSVIKIKIIKKKIY